MRTIIDLSQFISKLALAFVNVEPDRVDQEIDSALRQLGEYVKADSAFVFFISQDQESIGLTHAWHNTKFHDLREKLQKVPCKRLPWFTEEVKKGNMVYVPSISKLPKKANKESKEWKQLNIGSLLVLPFYRDKTPSGFIGFGTINREGKWGQDEVALLKIAGDLVSNVLARREVAQQQKEKVEELSALYRLAAAMAETNTVEELVEESIKIISETLYTDSFGLSVFNQKTGLLDTMIKLPESKDKRMMIDPSQGVVGKVFRTGESVRLGHVEDDEDYINLVFDSCSELCVPIRIGENVIGAINVESKQPNAFTEKEQNLLELFARQLGIGIEKQRLFEKVQDLATKDPLTGLYNRRHFFETAEREFAQAKRYDMPLTLIMLDLDKLKQANDQYGHVTGDRMLIEVGRLLRKGTRSADMAARYGGDEFVIMLPGTNLKEGRRLAKRLNELFEDARIASNGEQVGISISQGLAERDGDCPTLELLLDRADSALLAVKQMGKKQILSWAEMEKV